MESVRFMHILKNLFYLMKDMLFFDWPVISCVNIDDNDGQCPHLLKALSEPSEVQRKFIEDLARTPLQIYRAETYEEMTLDEANDKYISNHYPNIASEIYCWPIVYKYKKYGETTGQILKDANNKKMNVRRGECAEDTVRNIFHAMFFEKNIPSFFISSYVWRTTFLNELSDMSRRFKELFPEESDVDLMISIPEKCIFLVEVKATETTNAIRTTLDKGFSQCTKSFNFVSSVLADVSNESHIPVITVLALPNAQRTTVTPLYCERCCHHIITHEDIVNINKLYDWFQQLMSNYSSNVENSQFSENIFKKLIGRLVGPCSIKETETILHAITDTVSNIENQCVYQLTPQQVHSHCQLSEQFVWIRGVPGSGKTLLGFSKADSIINCDAQNDVMHTTEGPSKKHVLYIINGHSPEEGSSCLMHSYKAKFGEGSNSCEVRVREFPEIKTYISIHHIPQLIEILQSKHEDSTVHILLEECRMQLTHVDQCKFAENWEKFVEKERLGSVWIIQNSFAADKDKIAQLGPDFKVIELDNVMRMSVPNIKFLNYFLKKEYTPGHEIAGARPSVYRMSCICPKESNDKYHCSDCYQIRVLWMLRTVLTDLAVDTTRKVRMSNVFITSSFTEEILKKVAKKYDTLPSVICFNKLPENRDRDALFVASSIHHFTGCEMPHVFIELNCILQDGFTAMESLTRALGKMVLLDGGYCCKEDKEKYDETINILTAARNEGVVHISTMKDDVITDAKNALFRDEMLSIMSENEEFSTPPTSPVQDVIDMGEDMIQSLIQSLDKRGMTANDYFHGMVLEEALKPVTGVESEMKKRLEDVIAKVEEVEKTMKTNKGNMHKCINEVKKNTKDCVEELKERIQALERERIESIDAS